MSYRMIVAVATGMGPIYNGRIVEAAEVILDDERYVLVDERRVVNIDDRGQLDAFLRRRGGESLHSFGRRIPQVMLANPWNIPREAWGECIRTSVVSLMSDVGECPARLSGLKTLNEAAGYFGVAPSDGSPLATARAAGQVYAEVLRMRREDEVLRGEPRMLMNDGW